MELWNKDSKLSDIESIYESEHREVIMQMGQLTPLETIRFLDVNLTEQVSFGLGDQFTIRDRQTACPVSIHHVIPLKKGCLARVSIPKKLLLPADD